MNTKIKKNKCKYRNMSPKSYLKDRIFEDITTLLKKKKKKIKESEFDILTVSEHNKILDNNYKA